MIQVSENLWRGPRPENLEDLQKQGFERIISLESGVYEFFHQDTLETEEQRPKDFGMISYLVPMSDITAPSREDVFRVINLILFTKKKTYLHCKSGVDRTGFVCAAFRMQTQGWTYDAAYAEWVNLGRHWWYDWWKLWLKKYEVNEDNKQGGHHGEKESCEKSKKI